MIDTIKEFDTSILLGMVVVIVGILSGFGLATDTTLLFFTNVVTYILGKGKNAKR